MLLASDTYIHNHLVFEETEKDILQSAKKIISTVRDVNIHSSCAEDTYLNYICDTIIEGISELLNDYHNEYFPDDGS